jgi:hypothetical protein
MKYLRMDAVSKSVMLSLAMEKHFSLLGKFVSYKENEVLMNGHRKQGCFVKPRHGKHSILLGKFVKLQRK